jgi:hypothetical protein
MSNSVYFLQECPTCGRRLHIRVEYLGRNVVCEHCRGKFEACDPASAGRPGCDPHTAVLRRAEELLESAINCGAGRSRISRPR